MNDDKQIQKLQRIVALLDPDAMTTSEFLKHFAIVIDLVKKLTASNKEMGVNLQEKYDEIDRTAKQFYSEASSNLEETKKKALAYCVQNCAQLAMDYCKSKMGEMESKMDKKIASVKDGERGLQGIQGKPGKDGKDGSPDTWFQIAEKLNKKEEIIEQKVVKGLEDELKRLNNLVNQKAVFGGGGGVGKTNVYYYDLSSSLDGSTKTFSMPAFSRIIAIFLSSAPVLRPAVDWTSDSSASTITFTSAVDANPLLLSGQSLMVLYAV